MARSFMNESVDKLLQPVTPEQPCGPDLSYDPSFDALEALLKGKPEVEIGNVQKPAEPPDWVELQKQSAEFLTRSKHLRVAVMFCACQLRTRGMPGFRDAVQFLRLLLEKYWATIYPILDPEDHNDPEIRLNILKALTLERGANAAGWLTIVDYLYGAEICRPKGMPPVTYDEVLAARKTPAEGATAKLNSAISSVGADVPAAQHQAITESIEAVRAMDQFITNTLGAGNAISFETLEKALNELRGVVAAFLPGSQAQEGAGPASEGSESPAAQNATGMSVRGPVKSRDDVVKLIESICAYYEQVEPGSPVPYLLRRVQKMVKMNFVETIKELNIAPLDTLRPAMGSALDNNPGA
jgi:type VI secretion system protein ImpA